TARRGTPLEYENDRVTHKHFRRKSESMTSEQIIFLTGAILVVAFLYSSVGHAGASGYIAVMSLFGLAPAVIKPTALVLNILVACRPGLARGPYWNWGRHFSDATVVAHALVAN